MTAPETLRRAAALMRERADASADQPWKAAPHPARRNCMTVQSDGLFLALYVQPQAAEHMASWHPAVALAVALLLENEASLIASTLDNPELHSSLNAARCDLLLAVARAYLGITEDKP